MLIILDTSLCYYSLEGSLSVIQMFLKYHFLALRGNLPISHYKYRLVLTTIQLEIVTVLDNSVDMMLCLNTLYSILGDIKRELFLLRC